MTAWVVLNGEKTKDIVEVIPLGADIYCADGGVNYLYESRLIPKIIMGDMDSIKPEVKEFYKQKGCEFAIFKREKDETDGQLIVDRALDDKPDEINIICGLGGRIDHMLGNFQLLYRIARHGVTAKIIGNDILAAMSGKEIVLNKDKDQIVSIIPYTDETILTLEGFRYNVKEFMFKKDTPIGLSNYIVDELGKITVNKGYPLVIISNNYM